MFESVSGIFVLKCVVGLLVRGAKNAILHLYRKAVNSSFRTNSPPSQTAMFLHFKAYVDNAAPTPDAIRGIAAATEDGAACRDEKLSMPLYT